MSCALVFLVLGIFSFRAVQLGRSTITIPTEYREGARVDVEEEDRREEDRREEKRREGRKEKEDSTQWTTSHDTQSKDIEELTIHPFRFRHDEKTNIQQDTINTHIHAYIYLHSQLPFILTAVNEPQVSILHITQPYYP